MGEHKEPTVLVTDIFMQLLDSGEVMNMAELKDVLHALIDDIEVIRMQSSEGVQSIYKQIDPVRMADPDDAQFDQALEAGLREELFGAMDKAYQCGGEAGRRISDREVHESNLGVLIKKTVQVATFKLTQALDAMNKSLDAWIAVARFEGMDADNVLESVDRSIKAAYGAEGVQPSRGLTLTTDLGGIINNVFRRAITQASRAGQLETYAEAGELSA